MKYWWFLNTRCEFKFRGKILVFGLNDLPIPSIQIHKKRKSELAFALFRSEVLVLILGALMSAIFEVVGFLYSFCEFSEFSINSSWGIFEQNMRVVISWTMCQLSLGHRKKTLLRKRRTRCCPRLPARTTFVADTNLVSGRGTQKKLLILFRNILCPQQMFPSLRSMETQHSFCVPCVCAHKKHHGQQCVRNVSSFARAFKILQLVILKIVKSSKIRFKSCTK